jgi:hypothetical protein
MTTEEQRAFLTTKLKQVLEQLSHTQEALRVTQEQLGRAQARIEELARQKTPPPSFLKANVKQPQESQKKPRKKREANSNQARRRSTPTRSSSIGWGMARRVSCVWGLCCKKSRRKAMGVKSHLLFSLGRYSKQAGDERVVLQKFLSSSK